MHWLDPLPKLLQPRAAPLVLAALMLGAPAAGADRVFVLGEIVRDSHSPPGRRSEYSDVTAIASRGPVYAALNVGSFAPGLEVGWTRRDSRRSSYTVFARRRQGGVIDDTALELGTGQVAGALVGLGSLRLLWPDRPEDDNLLLVPGLGAEFYYGSHSFVSLRAVFDPRPNTGVTFRWAHRLAGDRWHLETVLAPRTDGVLNYAVLGRWRWLFAGFSHESDFDFSRIDRDVWSIGLQYDLGS